MTVGKEGTAMKHMVDSLAMSVSIGLQHGIPLEEYIDMFVNTRSEPSGFVQGSENVQMCSSILDYVARELDATYGSKQLTRTVTNEQTVEQQVEDPWNATYLEPQSKVEEVMESAGRPTLKVDSLTPSYRQMSVQASVVSTTATVKYNGDPCPSCQSMKLRRNGSCFVCDNCGSTTGCS